jgi:hypothetical protein
MGADEATILLTQAPIAFGETTVPAGAYTLYFIPSESGASRLAISRKIGGWGIPIDETQDVARIELKKDALAQPADQFTIAIEKDPANPLGGILKLMWENTQFSVPFTIKQ